MPNISSPYLSAPLLQKIVRSIDLKEVVPSFPLANCNIRSAFCERNSFGSSRVRFWEDFLDRNRATSCLDDHREVLALDVSFRTLSLLISLVCNAPGS